VSFHAKMMISAILLGNAVLVVELLRKKKLTESYTLLWLVVISCTAMATWADRLLARVTRFFGAIAPVSALTLLSLVFVLIMLIYFSMKISRLTKELKELSQQVALRTPPFGGRDQGEVSGG